MFHVSQSLLRMWEREFREINPRRSSHGIRIYTKEDINTIDKIYNLLKNQGMTINGAKQLMRKNPDQVDRTQEIRTQLLAMRDELMGIINELPSADESDDSEADD